ncbi:MAG: MFS transporter [Thermogutta sp.]
MLGASITSGLADLSYETANVILPGFLAALGLSPSVLGAIEGIADGIASFTKIAAGYLADRIGRRKPLVVLGYSLTVVGQAVMAVASAWGVILLGRAVGWLGRGIRGPLRDAIVSGAIPTEQRGRAFGFHRAADTLGAVVGPALGAAAIPLLVQYVSDRRWAPVAAFQIAMGLTVIPGVLAVLSFALLVRDAVSRPNLTLRFHRAVASLPRPFQRYLIAVGLFGLGDFAPTLLILAATQALHRHFDLGTAAAFAGGLYVLRNVFQATFSFPTGALADRIGHHVLLVSGYAVGTATMLLLVLLFTLPVLSGAPAVTVAVLIAVFVLAGIYMAVQEALEPVITSTLVPTEIKTTGFGVLGAVNGLGDLGSSILVGSLWTHVSPQTAFGAAGLLMFAGAIVLATLGSPTTLRE